MSLGSGRQSLGINLKGGSLAKLLLSWTRFKGRSTVLPRCNPLKFPLCLFVLDNIWLHSAQHLPLPLLIELRYKYSYVKGY